jgi:hypothetical protein
LDIIKRANAILTSSLPEAFVVKSAILDACPKSVNEPRICYGDFEVRALLVPLKTEQVFPHDHLDGMDRRLMLPQLRLEIILKARAIVGYKHHRRRNVQIVVKVGNV